MVRKNWFRQYNGMVFNPNMTLSRTNPELTDVRYGNINTQTEIGCYLQITQETLFQQLY